MKNKRTALLFALILSALATFATNDASLNTTLRELKNELQASYLQMPHMQQYFDREYNERHQEMLDVINTSNELSIQLYTQEQYMTFDMAYALKKVTVEYKDFNENRRPYDKSVNGLDFAIDRYTRLLEALHRLPEQTYRDSCIFYASEMLAMCEMNRNIIMQDSIQYQEAFLRIKENYDYAEERYHELQQYVFHDGQLPYLIVLKHFKPFWRTVQSDLSKQYDAQEIENGAEEKRELHFEDFSPKGARVFLMIACLMQLVILALFWGVVYGLLWLIFRYTKRKPFLHTKQMPLFSVLVGTVLYILIFRYIWTDYEYLQMGVRNINTFLWLLIAIAASLLLRVNPEEIKHDIMLYLPSLFIAFVIIVFRNTFVPDSLMILLFPSVLLLVVVRQLLVCISKKDKASSVDRKLGWTSFFFYVIAFVAAVMGYTFVCLLILIWWYFQLAVLLSVVCVSDLLNTYKERWLDARVNAVRERITYVTGQDRESLLFVATWLYDLVRQVGIPVIMVLSLPMCAHLSLNIFDFNDLFIKYYTNPFISFTDEAGITTMCISGKSIVWLLILFFILRYVNRAIHAIWQYFRYALFMRKNNRTSIRSNEINLSLGNSIISVLIWMIYAVVVVEVWKIPTGSLGMIAGGLSAGIGLALKDILNNFIYGIQLMGGRLRVGDWIECDGVRGRVSAINYQCVQVETLDGTEMSFLNASLFGKNFNNLTRNNSYEFTKIIVGVAYGTDVQRVREVLVEAMKQVRTKDRYGRELVEPQYGINVVVDNMSDSSVDIAVKQYVLVAERIGYVDRSKEVIYNALNAAGITIPFPQCDVHLIKDDNEK